MAPSLGNAVNGNSAIVLLGKWLEAKYGVACGEHPAFGGVHTLEHAGSPPGGDLSKFWTNEERAANGASEHYAAAALDVNHDTGDESGVLNKVYDVLSAEARELGVVELFFEDRGIPGPAENHEDHLHVAIIGPPTGALVKLVSGFGNGQLSGVDDFVGTVAGDAASFVGDKALGLAKDIVASLLDSIGAEGARILLYIALVVGGATLIYYGTARAAGMQQPIGTAVRTVATKGMA